MEKQRISPEVAYVKSKDLLVGGMSDVVVAREKVKYFFVFSNWGIIGINITKFSSLCYTNCYDKRKCFAL